MADVMFVDNAHVAPCDDEAHGFSPDGQCIGCGISEVLAAEIAIGDTIVVVNNRIRPGQQGVDAFLDQADASLSREECELREYIRQIA